MIAATNLKATLPRLASGTVYSDYTFYITLLLCIIMIIHFAVVSVPTILQIYVACTGL